MQTAFHAFGFPHIAGQRSQMAMRLGGAKLGQRVGQALAASGLPSGEGIQRLCAFLNHIKAGISNYDQTAGELRIKENIEPLRTLLVTELREPSCYFTTGFLSGCFSALSGQQVQETHCIAAGDPHCTWEIG